MSICLVSICLVSIYHGIVLPVEDQTGPYLNFGVTVISLFVAAALIRICLPFFKDFN